MPAGMLRDFCVLYKVYISRGYTDLRHGVGGFDRLCIVVSYGNDCTVLSESYTLGCVQKSYISVCDIILAVMQLWWISICIHVQ